MTFMDQKGWNWFWIWLELVWNLVYGLKGLEKVWNWYLSEIHLAKNICLLAVE